MPLQLFLDESVRGDAITVGGFFLNAVDAGSVVAEFQALKQRLGLDAHDELKHTLGRKEPSRKKLDGLGVTRASYVPRILDWLATQPVRVITNTNFPSRSDIKPEALYCDALDYCMRGFANVIQFGGHHNVGPHSVTVDTPPDQRKKPSKKVGKRLRSVANGKEAAPRIYQERYNSPYSYPGGSRAPAFKDLGLMSHLLTTPAKHSDLLQIADFVAGTVSEWADQYLSDDDIFGSARGFDWRDENVKRLLPITRRYRGSAWKYGIMVFPEGWQDYSMRQRIYDLDSQWTTAT